MQVEYATDRHVRADQLPHPLQHFPAHVRHVDGVAVCHEGVVIDLRREDRLAGTVVEGHDAARQLAGEWLFAHAVFDRTAESDEQYFDDILRCRSGWVIDDVAPLHPSTIRRLADTRWHVEPFLDQCAGEILALRPRLIGFTTVFQQHVASLALARRLKERAPTITIVFGGSNCEGVMGAETVRQFPFVDAAVSGEGDLIFPEIVT